jgi:hypothetical protein
VMDINYFPNSAKWVPKTYVLYSVGPSNHLSN